jgi:antitoxin VapB
MPLNIKDIQTCALAKRLANLTGESLTQAIKQAVQERLARVEKSRASIRLADELDHIALHCAGLPRRDKRSAEQIIGYDECGLPVR